MRHRLVLMLVPVMLAAAPEHRERPAPTGLRILSTTLEPPTSPNSGRPVALMVENITDKTIVAIVATFEEFRADGTHTYPPGNETHGVGMDHDGPSPLDPRHEDWIRPRQTTTIRLYATGNPETASVRATIAGLIYEDRTSEGNAAQMIFLDREKSGREAREAASRESSPTKKKELEKRAEWYESHGPLEVE